MESFVFRSTVVVHSTELVIRYKIWFGYALTTASYYVYIQGNGGPEYHFTTLRNLFTENYYLQTEPMILYTMLSDIKLLTEYKCCMNGDPQSYTGP